MVVEENVCPLCSPCSMCSEFYLGSFRKRILTKIALQTEGRAIFDYVISSLVNFSSLRQLTLDPLLQSFATLKRHNQGVARFGSGMPGRVPEALRVDDDLPV